MNTEQKVREKYPLTIVQRGPYKAYITRKKHGGHFILETYKEQDASYTDDEGTLNHHTGDDDLESIVTLFLEKTEMVLQAREKEKERGEI